MYASRRTTERVLRISVVGGVFLWGLYQSFWNLAAANFNADEPVYIDAGWSYVHGIHTANLEHPPTAKYILGLAQVLVGEGYFAGRIAVACAVFLTGVIIWLWTRMEIGWVGATVAAGFWLLLPRGVIGSGLKIDRFALLDPFAVFFLVAAMAAGWVWYRKSQSLWLVLAAVSMGLAVTSKVSVAVCLPVFLVVAIARRSWKQFFTSALIFVPTFTAVVVLVYLPIGIRSSIGYMLAYQSEHNAAGHLVDVAGIITNFPPWWANLWYTIQGVGPVVAALVLLAALAALLSPNRLFVGYVGMSLACLLVFHLFVAHVALAHYYYVWMWVLCVLCGIGVDALIHRFTGTRLARLTQPIVSAIVAVGIVVAAWLSVSVWQERPTGMALVTKTLAAHGISDGRIYVTGMATWEYANYLGDRATTSLADADVTALAVAHSTRFPPDEAAIRLLTEDPEAFTLIELDAIDLYVPTDELVDGAIVGVQ